MFSNFGYKNSVVIGLFILFSQQVFAAQTCKTSSILSTSPIEDFEVHGDGTVTDKVTGLMWKVCSEGQTFNAGECTDATTTHTWAEALALVDTLNSGTGFPEDGVTYNDWRLPNLKELKSITELQCATPAINLSIFPNTPSASYWSSSPRATYGTVDNLTWIVHFDFGYDNNDNNNRETSRNNVRFVRSGHY
jgi:hypothetical protein